MALRQLDVNEFVDVLQCLRYQNASTRDQAITIGAGDTTVTCPNPHIVKNNQADAATIYIKLVGETSFKAYYFLGGQSETLCPSEIGGSTTGSDSGTLVIVRGVE